MKNKGYDGTMVSRLNSIFVNNKKVVKYLEIDYIVDKKYYIYINFINVELTDLWGSTGSPTHVCFVTNNGYVDYFKDIRNMGYTADTIREFLNEYFYKD